MEAGPRRRCAMEVTVSMRVHKSAPVPYEAGVEWHVVSVDGVPVGWVCESTRDGIVARSWHDTGIPDVTRPGLTSERDAAFWCMGVLAGRSSMARRG